MSSKSIFVTVTVALVGSESVVKTAYAQPDSFRIADSSSVISRLRTSENLYPTSATSIFLIILGHRDQKLTLIDQAGGIKRSLFN